VRHDAENDAASLGSGEGERFFQNRRNGRAVDDDVSLAAENRFTRGSKILVVGINRVSRTKFPCLGEFVVVQVHCDDGVSAGEFGAQNGSKADATTANDHDRLSDANLRVIIDHPETGGERIGEQRADFEIGFRGDGRQAVFRYHGKLVEGSDAARIAALTFPRIKGRTGFDAGTGAPVENHAVAGFDVAHLGTGFENGAATFVTEQMRQKAVRALDAVDLPDL